MLIGSSGTLMIVLNETAVAYNYQNAAGRPYGHDSDHVSLPLKKGKNRLLVVTRQGIGSWSFSVQIAEPTEFAIAARSPATSIEAHRAFAERHSGDPKHGEELFFDPKGVGCVKCHSAAGQGTANVGPDLTGLALKYDKTEIIRSVLEPSSRIATGYQPVLVATKGGQVITGHVRSETDATLELIDADARITRVSKAEIEERRVSEVSLMPKDLVQTLSVVEFADLISYLQSLRTAPSRPTAAALEKQVR
jgi:putative heme-binding domain-containing protein